MRNDQPTPPVPQDARSIHQTNLTESPKKQGAKSLADILQIIGVSPSPDTETKSIKPLIAKQQLVLFEPKIRS